MLVAQNRPAGSQTPSFIRTGVGAPSVRVEIHRSSPGSVIIATPVPAAAIQLPGRPNQGATAPSGTATAASTVGGLAVGSASARVNNRPDRVSTCTSLSPVQRTPSPSSQRYPLHAVGSAKSIRHPFGLGNSVYPVTGGRCADRSVQIVVDAGVTTSP